PIAPADICLRAISTHLCALACGRRFFPVRFTCAAMRARLASNTFRSNNNAGVGISCLPVMFTGHYTLCMALKPAGAKTIEEYLDLIDEPRQTEIRMLHAMISKAVPK